MLLLVFIYRVLIVHCDLNEVFIKENHWELDLLKYLEYDKKCSLKNSSIEYLGLGNIGFLQELLLLIQDGIQDFKSEMKY